MFPDGTLAVTSAGGDASRRGYRGGLSVKPVLQLKGVGKTYRRGDEQVHLLVDFDFTLDAGEFVVVTGPSGAGKSTLLHIAGGLDAPDSGTVAVTGQDVWSMSTGARAAFRRRNLGFVFQFFNLLPMLSAEENITLPLTIAGEKVEHAWLEQLLESVGLKDRRKHRPSELSGGQQQRVAIARALCMQPKIMLFDEPTSALDPEMVKEVLDTIVGLALDGMTMVVVSHEMGFARQVANRLVLMDAGQIIEMNEPEAFFSYPRHERTKLFLSQILR